MSSSRRRPIPIATRRASSLGCGVFIACAFLSGVTGGCRDDSTQTSQEVAAQTNVVWIFLDALRADHLSS
ncbi:MAG: hypothetical protein JRG89_15855 [Deltaproteobacteria bacterium]|nr:hypothetical protein [Deltaproteobacteria bacterium]